jgi:hypothetical protein
MAERLSTLAAPLSTMTNPAQSLTLAAMLTAAGSALAVNPPGDNFESPYIMTQPVGSWVVDSAVTATTQPDEPVSGTGHTVWFRWTAPADGPVAFDTLTGYFPTVIKAFTGTAINNLTPVTPLADPSPVGARPNRLRFQAQAGQTYHVQVDASTAQRGRFVLKWWLGVPANDAFANAAWVDSGLFYFPRSSVNATKEPGEPNHAGNAGGRSVWLPWTAEMSRTLNITTEACDFDTLLAVYTGDSLANLTEIASSDDHEGQTWSKVSFETVRDQTYWIVIDGKDGDGGSILLDIRHDLIEPDFTGVRRDGDSLIVDMICNDGRRFQIQSSTDMTTWSPWWSTPESERGELHFTMPGGFDTSTKRFFRAVQMRDND